MNVNGREVHFKRTVEANCDIADLCPDKDASKLDALFSGSYQESQRMCAKFIAALSNAYEHSVQFADPGYKPSPLTDAEALTLDPPVFSALFDEALAIWRGEKPTIETVEKETKGKKKSRVTPSN